MDKNIKCENIAVAKEVTQNGEENLSVFFLNVRLKTGML